jgi:hypothetical protein
MWYEDKIMRTLRCRTIQKPGMLGRLLTVIGDLGGLTGEIKTILMGSSHVVRDIVIFADDADHMTRLIQAVRGFPGGELLEIRDDVMEMHQGGKIAIRSRYEINTVSDLRKVYTPGVAEVSLKIQKNPALARRFTSIRHMVAIVTDGSAVLGLGDIGPLAAIAPTFSAIQLEDISAPRCFEIERRLQEPVSIPVMHDDQHGTAVVVTAALMNASRLTGVSHDRRPGSDQAGQGPGSGGVLCRRREAGQQRPGLPRHLPGGGRRRRASDHPGDAPGRVAGYCRGGPRRGDRAQPPGPAGSPEDGPGRRPGGLGPRPQPGRHHRLF